MAKKENLFKIAGVLAPIIAALIAFVPDWWKSESPRFVVETPIVQLNTAIIIRAANDSANLDKPLSIEFDKHLWEGAGIPFKKDSDETQRWKFDISNHNPTSEMLKLKAHKLRFGFPGEELTKEEHAVSFIKVMEPPTTPENPSSKPSGSRTIFIVILAIFAIIVVILAIKNKNG